jgi:hypothetical protein
MICQNMYQQIWFIIHWMEDNLEIHMEEVHL